MTLQLHSDSSGLCHYLAGKPVRVGDVIEVFLFGKWTKVEYGWSGATGVLPFGFVDQDATTILIKPNTPVRWPQS